MAPHPEHLYCRPLSQGIVASDNPSCTWSRHEALGGVSSRCAAALRPGRGGLCLDPVLGDGWGRPSPHLWLFVSPRPLPHPHPEPAHEKSGIIRLLESLTPGSPVDLLTQSDDAILSWRAVVLYGLNTATYKIALAHCLQQFALADRDRVSMPELAEAFLDLYAERLATGRPQLLLPGRLTVMERILARHTAGAISREEAIARVARDAFGDVVPRFHTVGDASVPVRFYDASPDGLVLRDAAFWVVARSDSKQLGAELAARWDLLEAAFELKRDGGVIANDIRTVYLTRGHDRRSVTHLRPVLHGYQQGRCFYCGEAIPVGEGHVDHVIPRQVIHHDEPWNLVLAHALCNVHKSDLLPSLRSIALLVARNEHLIASNHPLKQRLVAQLGGTPERRRWTLLKTYEDAAKIIPHTWEDVRGFDPTTDRLYQAVVRRLAR